MRQMPKIVLLLIYMSALLGIFFSETIRANEDDLYTTSLDKADTVDAGVTNESTQLRSRLVAWLVERTEHEITEIEEKLVLNRSLESKVCPGDLVFSYVRPNERLILANCKSHWRRFIKQPTSLRSTKSEPVQVKAKSTKLQTVLLIKKAVAKGERILDSDLEASTLALDNYRSPNLLEIQGLPLIAANDLAKGQPVSSGDIITGRRVVVAKTTIPAGSGISETLVTKEFRFEDVPTDAIDDETSWSFMETNRRIAEGDILRERHLIKTKLVRRSDPVTLIHKSPALQIITTGVAQQDGYFGQSVKVLNTESGRNVMGVVTGRGKVVIESGN